MVTTRAKKRAQQYPVTEDPQKTLRTSANTQATKASLARYARYQKMNEYVRIEYTRELMEKRNLIRDLSSLQVYVKRWVNEFAASEPQDLERLSDSQKCTIISSFKGYCVQEDWDTLMGHLSDLHRDMILEVFLETLLLKEVFEKIFNPLSANPFSATLWRSETIRLANSVKVKQANNTELGSYHQERRNSLLSQFVDTTLSGTPIQWLLKKPESQEEEKERRERLYELYQVAAETASTHANARGHYEFHRLDRLPETFDQASKTMEAHTYHFIAKESTRLDGRRVLIVVQPGVTLQWISETFMDGLTVCSPAYIVVEDPEGSKGLEEPKEEDKREFYNLLGSSNHSG
ncbi:hypothetical protein PHISCL_07927 [Aspergillus sclerotialis]|uniref:Uncharacterized protein n=1 Tax=Aspergillus sclerotialis TaxID=2070753 RepID=A0A3A2ZPC0_9EURO|nr:hypothetical protein PHISCL_07927 [Aspergillus sclerotialis]